MVVVSRRPLYRGGRHSELIAGVSDEGVLGGHYTRVTVISRWPLYRGGRYIKLIGRLSNEGVLGG